MDVVAALPRPPLAHHATAEPAGRGEVLSDGKAEVVRGINASFGAVAEASALGDARPDVAMILPLRNRSGGDVAGALTLGLNPYRELDDEYAAGAAGRRPA